MNDYMVSGNGDASLRKALKMFGVKDPQLPKEVVPVGEVNLGLPTGGYVWKYEGPNGAWGIVFTPQGDATGLIMKLSGISGVSVSRDSAPAE
jgi:hypothetical protein